MQCTIEINMDNSAFQDGAGGGHELAAILENLCMRYDVEGAVKSINLRDSNGNAVGRATIKGSY